VKELMSLFDVGDRVVYPHHGAAVIVRRESREYNGEKTDYLVTLGSTILQVSATDHYRRSPLEAGQPVTVHFHPEGIHVL